MIIPPGDYQGHLCSGVALPSSLTLTPGRTWTLSSPYLRPGSSHQVPSLSETPVSGSQTGLVCSSHHKGSQGQLPGRGSMGFRQSSRRGPSVLLQAPHLASSQDWILASPQLQPRPLTPGPQALQDPDVRKPCTWSYRPGLPGSPLFWGRAPLLPQSPHLDSR